MRHCGCVVGCQLHLTSSYPLSCPLSTKTDVALRYPPEKLASAMLFTAATIMGIELPDVNGQSFYETYKLTFQELLDMFESVVGR